MDLYDIINMLIYRISKRIQNQLVTDKDQTKC